MVEKLFRYISFLKFPFYLSGFALCFYELIYKSENLIQNTGLCLFLIGIALNLEAFTPQPEFTFSKREIKKFSNRKLMNTALIFSTIMFFSGILIGLFFFKIKFFYPSAKPSIVNEIHNVGFGCLALCAGGLANIKQTYDRFKIFCKVSQD